MMFLFVKCVHVYACLVPSTIDGSFFLFFLRWYWDVRKNIVCMDARVSVYHMARVSVYHMARVSVYHMARVSVYHMARVSVYHMARVSVYHMARVSVYHMGFLVWFMVFNATFNNILVISWQSV
jgi:hypothetical protein